MDNQLSIPVTLVTQNAAQDAPDDFYMDGLLDLWRRGTDEVPGPLDYPKLLAILGESPSRKAWWQHRVVGNRTTFPPDARNRLRAAIDNMPPVQPPVTAVTAERIDPNAAMYWIGQNTGEKSRLVLMIAPDTDPAQIYVNGGVQAQLYQSETLQPVTPSVGAQGANGDDARQKRTGVSVSRATVEQNERRQAIGATWQDVIETGLQTMEKEVSNPMPSHAQRRPAGIDARGAPYGRR